MSNKHLNFWYNATILAELFLHCNIHSHADTLSWSCLPLILCSVLQVKRAYLLNHIYNVSISKSFPAAVPALSVKLLCLTLSLCGPCVFERKVF